MQAVSKIQFGEEAYDIIVELEWEVGFRVIHQIYGHIDIMDPCHWKLSSTQTV